MPLGKKFFAGRSELTHLQRCVADDIEFAQTSQVHVLRLPANATAQRTPHRIPLKAVPSTRAPRQFTLAVGLDVISRAATRFAIFADLAFTNFPVAVLSWVVTQFCVGCAAYAEAMYPSVGYVGSNDAVRRYVATKDERIEGDHASLSPNLAPDLKDLSASAVDAEAKRSPAPPIQPGIAPGFGGNGNIIWLDVMRKTPSQRVVSTAQLITAWLSKRRRPSVAAGRSVAAELRNYDRRTKRGAATPRFGTE